MRRRPTLPAPRPLAVVMTVLLVAVGCLTGEARAQLEAGRDDLSADAYLSTYPTIEGIRKARQAGHPVSLILSWIREYDAVFPLDLDEAVQLRAEGVEVPIIAAMAGMPAPRVADLLGTLETVYVARPGPRQGLSKNRLLKMLELGAPEEEILRAIAENGSRAEISLEEGVKLLEGGASPRLVVAIARGVVPPEAASRVAVDPNAPLLDDLLGVEEEPSAAGEPLDLDEIFEEAGVAAEPRGGPQLVVVSDPPGSQLFVAPGNVRPDDLLKMSRPEGRTPVSLGTVPGTWWVLVEKRLDEFDTSIIPAVRSVHDGDGTTRTLIHSGTVYYDVQRCCQPMGLGGPVKITRIGENQPGVLLGDEFEGMPPYLWDGNRFFIMRVEDGRIRRVIKVYDVSRAAGEELTLSASFIPAMVDPLSHPASMEAVSTRARATWEVPPEEDMRGVARITGIPEEEVSRIRQRLLETGKALWKEETGEGLRILALALETEGRTRLHEVKLERTGLYGRLATPGLREPEIAGAGERQDTESARSDRAAAPKAEKEPKPLPAIRRVRTPETEIPLLRVINEGASAALVRLDDGLIIYAEPGEAVETPVSPGTTWVEARFDAEGADLLHGRISFSYKSTYTLILN